MTLPRTSKGRESARDLSRSAGGRVPAANHAPPPIPASVQCDLCEAPMALPPHVIAQGRIFGLLTCSQCIEDELTARVCQ